MKYFEISIIFLIIFIFVSLWLFRCMLQRKLYRAYLLRKLTSIYKKECYDGVFSSYLIFKIADFIYELPKNKRMQILSALESESYKKISEAFALTGEMYSYLFSVQFKLNEAKIKLKSIKEKSDNVLIYLSKALVCAKEFDYVKLRKILDDVKKCRPDKIQKGMFLRLEALLNMTDSDMFSASKNSAMSAKIFKKYGLPYEEAESYFLLGEIYRISAVFDVSQIMYDEAAKIYALLKYPAKEATVKASKSMLLMAQERFDEAKDLLVESKKIFRENKLHVSEGEIVNQESLLNMLQKKYVQSLKCANKALEIHQKYKNTRGMAFSYELISLIRYLQKKYREVVFSAELSMKYYLKTKNYAGFEDCAFVLAQAYFGLSDYDNAQKVCREIIKIHNKYPTCFHIANVYSLLGLIFVKLKDFNRAAALFKKSLNMEQCNERYSAAATDYVNLALVCSKGGRTEEAAQYLQSALESADKHGNVELCNLISEYMKKTLKI